MKTRFLWVTIIFSSCWGQTDKSKLLGKDYRLFQDTPSWEIAKAVRSNDFAELEKIAKNQKVDINFQEPKYGNTLVMLTVLNSQYDMLKKLLELGADPNIHNHYDGSSAIIEAAGVYTPREDTSFIKLLLKHGANPNDEQVGPRNAGYSGRATPLNNAAKESLLKVKTLVEAGADVNHKNEYATVTPLNSAVIQNNFDVALYLLKKGADYNVCVFHRPPKNKKDGSKGKDIYLVDLLREITIPLDHDDYFRKMEIVDFLKTKGIDYRKVPIPDFIVERAKKSYPNTWKEYLDKY